jgi:hypothetical protein
VVIAWTNYDVQRHNTFDVLHAASQTAEAPSPR